MGVPPMGHGLAIQGITEFNITTSLCLGNISRNFEACTSELLEILKEMFPLYYMDSDMLSTYSNTQSHTRVLTVAKGYNF